VAQADKIDFIMIMWLMDVDYCRSVSEVLFPLIKFYGWRAPQEALRQDILH